MKQRPYCLVFVNKSLNTGLVRWVGGENNDFHGMDDHRVCPVCGELVLKGWCYRDTFYRYWYHKRCVEE